MSGNDLFDNDTTAAHLGTAPDPQGPPVTSTAAASDTPPDPAPAAPAAPSAPEAPAAPSGGLADLVGDPSIGHVFDQTNGIIDGLDGDSDGTARSDVLDSRERADENPAFEAFEGTEAPSNGDTDDTRATGS